MANEFIARNGLIAQNNSTVTGSLNVTGGITGSLQGTSSYATTASYITGSIFTNSNPAVSASYAVTAQSASHVNTLNQSVTISGSLVLTGSLSTNDGVSVQTITASIVSASQFTGSLFGTASYVTGSIHTSTNPALSASYALTASYALSSAGGGGGGAVSQSLYSSSFGITLDGGGGVISTGQKGYYTVNYSGIITGWQVIGDQAGSISINIWKTGSGAIPTTASSIVGTEKPTLTSQQINSDTVLTSFTTSFSAYDTFGYNVDSATTVSRVNLIIFTQKT